ncbi:hypothetical protein BGP77_11715 [Saccharospirillum sp. MSK14-1]|uniref:hypothetical protein n=1 Tax=Saccharospirillum sp. MSK14-1 TaxID=1897632 RepID=UPI000D3376C6|nr:hypothetical protein [Saccharospirillum sp. MSK14-1]PTY38534.1 hypothetical protein BGP77_11715 [Saccharospirillum sp. MSK14-1]
MKKTFPIACAALMLFGCVNDTTDSVYPFSMSLKTTNACGISESVNQYEILHYDSDGQLISRFQPDEFGAVSARFTRKYETLAIVEQREYQLNVMVFVDMPVNEYGDWWYKTNSSDGCDCEQYDITVRPGSGSARHLNFSAPAAVASVESAVYNNVNVCKQPDSIEPLLVAYANDSDTESLNYFVSESIDALANEDNEVEILVTDPGRLISVATPENVSGAFYYSTGEMNLFKTDYTYSPNVLDHERVEPIQFVARKQFGMNYPLRNWTVKLPMSRDTTLINIEEPLADYEQLLGLLEKSQTQYDFSEQKVQDLLVVRYGMDRDGGWDEWTFVLPSKGNLKTNYDLPDDYPGKQGESYRSHRFFEEFSLYNVKYTDVEEVQANPEILKKLLGGNPIATSFAYEVEETFYINYK